jgi:hypothetical protein
MFINVPSQQADGKLQKRNITQTEILKNNKQDTYEIYTHDTKDRKFKSLISKPYNIKLIIKTDRV